MLGFCSTECGKCGKVGEMPDDIQHDANCPYSPIRKAMIDEAVRHCRSVGTLFLSVNKDGTFVTNADGFPAVRAEFRRQAAA